MDMDEEVICPNCGAGMKPSPNGKLNTYVCPDCGSSMEREGEENFDCGSVCPNCNRSLDGSECPHCGYYLGSDFE